MIGQELRVAAKSPDLKTYFVVQSFSKDRAGVRMDAPIQAQSEASARRTAERLSSRKSSVIAFSRTGDPGSGEFDEPVVLVSYGDMFNGGVDSLPF